MPSGKAAGQGRIGASGWAVLASTEEIYTFFEGTSDSQRLVIARAISGMRIRWVFARAGRGLRLVRNCRS